MCRGVVPVATPAGCSLPGTEATPAPGRGRPPRVRPLPVRAPTCRRRPGPFRCPRPTGPTSVAADPTATGARCRPITGSCSSGVHRDRQNPDVLALLSSIPPLAAVFLVLSWGLGRVPDTSATGTRREGAVYWTGRAGPSLPTPGWATHPAARVPRPGPWSYHTAPHRRRVDRRATPSATPSTSGTTTAVPSTCTGVAGPPVPTTRRITPSSAARRWCAVGTRRGV